MGNLNDDTVYQMSTLSSGTLSKLFGTNVYEEIENKHKKWMSWFYSQPEFIKNACQSWSDAWLAYNSNSQYFNTKEK